MAPKIQIPRLGPGKATGHQVWKPQERRSGYLIQAHEAKMIPDSVCFSLDLPRELGQSQSPAPSQVFSSAQWESALALPAHQVRK